MRACFVSRGTKKDFKKQKGYAIIKIYSSPLEMVLKCFDICEREKGAVWER